MNIYGIYIKQSKMVNIVTYSGVLINRYYKLVKLGNGFKHKDLLIGTTSSKNIINETFLGKLVQIRQYGRPYDPDVSFLFENEKGETIEYEPTVSGPFCYVEYNPDDYSDIKSMWRTIERTSLLKIEIEGNDWALRPENVVATQGIDLSSYA